MSELTPDDIWFCERMMDNHSNSGYLVTTKTGLVGRTYHKDADDKLGTYIDTERLRK